MSHLKGFSERVVAKAINVQPNELNEERLGFDFATILKIIEIIGTVITEITALCPNEAKGMIDSAKKPNWVQRVRFRAKVLEHARASGLPRAMLLAGKLADSAMDEAGRMTEEDLRKIVEESAPSDNMLV